MKTPARHGGSSDVDEPMERIINETPKKSVKNNAKKKETPSKVIKTSTFKRGNNFNESDATNAAPPAKRTKQSNSTTLPVETKKTASKTKRGNNSEKRDATKVVPPVKRTKQSDSTPARPAAPVEKKKTAGTTKRGNNSEECDATNDVPPKKISKKSKTVGTERRPPARSQFVLPIPHSKSTKSNQLKAPTSQQTNKRNVKIDIIPDELMMQLRISEPGDSSMSTIDESPVRDQHSLRSADKK